jgi:TonB family protein
MKHKKTWPVSLILLTLCCPVAHADDRRLIEKRLRKTYDNYALCLIPYASENFHFDCNGQLVGISALAGIVPPKAVYMKEPTFTQSAREKRLPGTAVVSLVVNEKGLPEILEVTEDLGEGVDTQSLLAVAEWRFRPATLNGQPVAVRISVEVSFRLF